MHDASRKILRGALQKAGKGISENRQLGKKRSESGFLINGLREIMENKRYYIDTCIYLNLWQKEEINGINLWEYAKDFLEKMDNNRFVIYYSGFILKELMHVLTKEEFESKRILFESSPNFKKVFLSEDELQKARRIEKETKNKISFFDIIHMLLAKKTNSVLITRDRKLIQTSEKYGIEAKRPEEL